MNILYLHGLDSSLNLEKRTILEKYGTVYAPLIDYRKDTNGIETILSQFNDIDINAIVGSSMGGFAAYYIADALQRPALLFNPALAYRSVTQEIPVIENVKPNLKHFILGLHDDIINPKTTLTFLADSMGLDDYTIKLRLDLEHRIPEYIFKEEVKVFFKRLCY